MLIPIADVPRWYAERKAEDAVAVSHGAKGVKPGDFNSYGARRGNHEVMVRGTFANVRLRNLLAPGTEGDRKSVV